MTGQKSRISASVVIEPTRPFDQNTRNVAAGADHREAKRVLGAIAEHQRECERASGMPIFLKT